MILTDEQWDDVNQARALSLLRLAEVAAIAGETDLTQAAMLGFTQAQVALGNLLAIIDLYAEHDHLAGDDLSDDDDDHHDPGDDTIGLPPVGGHHNGEGDGTA